MVPDDTRLPVFLVPYEMKHVGFSKVFVNMYVTFKYVLWEGKHPYGKLVSTIGPVDVLPNFYEYQLYCRSLHTSIQKFNKETSKMVKEMSQRGSMDDIIHKYKTIEDRRQDDWCVFTIDPEGSCDFDDGFSIRTSNDGWLLSIYISNVSILLDALGLWDSFSRRVSTIYLPDRRRPMLPTMLSDSLCSLQEQSTRFAFTMDIQMDADYNVVDISYKNCAIRVIKNYRYEEKELLRKPYYQELVCATTALSKKHKYIQHICDSHDIVSYLMTFMNYHCAKRLLENKVGVFRNSLMKQGSSGGACPSGMDPEIEKFIKIWYSSGGHYVNLEHVQDPDQVVRHELMNMDAYVHMTSPIRRLVDLLNMIKFQEMENMVVLDKKSHAFYDTWMSREEMEYINTTMRSIKKAQSDCSMLEFYTQHGDVVDRDHKGMLFDKVDRGDGVYQYVVYIPDLKLTLRTIVHKDYQEFTYHDVRIYLFQDEETLRRKIRLQLVDAT